MAAAVVGVIERDPLATAARDHDLIVVGGGIYGACLTLEAARSGLRTVLVERDDFGGATSWNSLRIAHGGLRYLQSLDLPRFFESVADRRWWLKTFPESVRPLPCLMPLYGRGLKRRAVLRVALGINDTLSRGRNRGIDRANRFIPDGRTLTPTETVARFPGVETDGLEGAALWHDAAIEDSHRVLVEILRWASTGPAKALNYVEAERLLVEDGRVRGIAAHDRVADVRLELRAPRVVNCGGPWVREVAQRFDRDRPELFRASLAFNVWFAREAPCESAVAVEPPGGRVYFLYPWKGGLYAGTYHAPWTGGPDSGEPGPDLLDAFLADLNAAVPGLNLAAADARRVFWGLLPVKREGSVALTRREAWVDHGAADGPAGLLSLAGIKFTTARSVAERTLRAILRRVPAEVEPTGLPRPAPSPPPSLDTIRTRLRYDPGGARADLVRLATTEAVVDPDDLLLRRTDWGLDPAEAEALRPAVAEALGVRGGSEHS